MGDADTPHDAKTDRQRTVCRGDHNRKIRDRRSGRGCQSRKEDAFGDGGFLWGTVKVFCNPVLGMALQQTRTTEFRL